MLKRLNRWHKLRRIRYVRTNRDIYIGARGTKRGTYDDVMTTSRFWLKLWSIGVYI